MKKISLKYIVCLILIIGTVSVYNSNIVDTIYATSKKYPHETANDNPLYTQEKGNYHGHIYTGGSYSKKYHYEEKCAGKNSHEITWEKAQSLKLGPCGTCVLK